MAESVPILFRGIGWTIRSGRIPISAIRTSRIPFTALVALLAFALAPFQTKAIMGGEPDNSAHPYLGMTYNDEYLCSGTLISSTVFLTAGHCTELFETGDRRSM